MRGDPCWRDLTCLEYHHETQPMPNPLSRWFHLLPRPLHRVEVARTTSPSWWRRCCSSPPSRSDSGAAVLMIVTQAYLMVSGNFAWLNLLTIVIGFAALDGHLIDAVIGLSPATALDPSPVWFDIVVGAVTVLVAMLVGRPGQEPAVAPPAHERQLRSLAPGEHLRRLRVDHPATGTRSSSRAPTTRTPAPRPCGGSTGSRASPPIRPSARDRSRPYHLRLDWLLWFVPLSPRYAEPWFTPFLRGLLEGNDRTSGRCIGHDPFPDEPPRAVRARRYRYRYTTRAERKQTGDFWSRDLPRRLRPPGDIGLAVMT